MLKLLENIHRKKNEDLGITLRAMLKLEYAWFLGAESMGIYGIGRS